MTAPTSLTDYQRDVLRHIRGGNVELEIATGITWAGRARIDHRDLRALTKAGLVRLGPPDPHHQTRKWVAL